MDAWSISWGDEDVHHQKYNDEFGSLRMLPARTAEFPGGRTHRNSNDC
jgi:hypothetical protein